MTTWDIAFVALGVIQVLALGLMGWTAYSMLGTVKRGQQLVQPALTEAKGVAGNGTAMVNQAKTQGLATFKHVKAVAEVVKKRVDTTVRIAKEVRPGLETTAIEVREKREAAAQTARSLSDIARGLGKVRAAAEKARDAATRSS